MKVESSTQLARHLQECRGAAGLTRQEMAKHLQVTYASYYKYERGDVMPKKDKLERLVSSADMVRYGKYTELHDLHQQREKEQEEPPEKGAKREPLFREAASYEDRTFEEQMNDLGVQVVQKQKPEERLQEKPEVVWHRSCNYGKGDGGIGNMISVNRTNLTIGKPVMDQIGAGERIEFGVMERNGKKMIVIKKNKYGWKAYQKKPHEGGRVTSTALLAWLEKQGVVRGLYKVSEVKGGWVATLEARRE